MTYFQPHEGMKGIDRTGDPFLAEEVVERMIAMADALDRLSLGPTPTAQHYRQRAQVLKVGDLVWVFDTISMKNPETRYKGLGYFLDARKEWFETDEAWEASKAEEAAAGYEMGEENRATDFAYYIQYGPNPEDVCRWTNCRVIALPGPGERWTSW